MAGTLPLRAVDRFPVRLGTHLRSRADAVMLFGKDNRLPGSALARDAMSAAVCGSGPGTVLGGADGTLQLPAQSPSVVLLTPVLQCVRGDDAHG